MAAIAIAIMMGGMWIRGVKGRLPVPGAKWRFYPLWREGNFLAGWHRLEDAAGSQARVAYAGTNLPYYLFGVGLRNQVRYVNINEYADFKMHDYHRHYASRGEPVSSSPTPDWDRRDASESAWIENLRDGRIEFLFLGLTNASGGRHNFHDDEGFTIERTWADGNPATFRLLHADRATRVYAVRFNED